MKRETLLTTAIVALLLLNLGTLGFLFFGRGPQPSELPPPPPPHGMGGPHEVDRMIIESLRFTPEQQTKFETLKRAHHESILKLDAEYDSTLKVYFNLLSSTPNGQQSKDSLEKELTEIQRKKASITFDHFSDLKALCSPEQRPAFDTLLPKLTRIIAPPKDFPPPPRRN